MLISIRTANTSTNCVSLVQGQPHREAGDGTHDGNDPSPRFTGITDWNKYKHTHTHTQTQTDSEEWRWVERERGSEQRKQKSWPKNSLHPRGLRRNVKEETVLLFRFHREENILLLLSQPGYSQSLIPVLLFHWVQFISIMCVSNNTVRI